MPLRSGAGRYTPMTDSYTHLDVYKRQAEGLKILDEAFTEEEYAIAVKKGNDELKEKINDALANLKESGKLDEIVAKYISADSAE